MSKNLFLLDLHPQNWSIEELPLIMYWMKIGDLEWRARFCVPSRHPVICSCASLLQAWLTSLLTKVASVIHQPSVQHWDPEWCVCNCLPAAYSSFTWKILASKQRHDCFTSLFKYFWAIKDWCSGTDQVANRLPNPFRSSWHFATSVFTGSQISVSWSSHVTEWIPISALLR